MTAPSQKEPPSYRPRRVYVGRLCVACDGDGDVEDGPCKVCDGEGQIGGLVTMDAFRRTAGVDGPVPAGLRRAV